MLSAEVQQLSGAIVWTNGPRHVGHVWQHSEWKAQWRRPLKVHCPWRKYLLSALSHNHKWAFKQASLEASQLNLVQHRWHVCNGPIPWLLPVSGSCLARVSCPGVQWYTLQTLQHKLLLSIAIIFLVFRNLICFETQEPDPISSSNMILNCVQKLMFGAIFNIRRHFQVGIWIQMVRWNVQINSPILEYTK